MDAMAKQRLADALKDRYSFIFKMKPEIALTDECLENATHIVAGIIEKCNKLTKDEELKVGHAYLLDVVGYYVLLAYDIQKTNGELLAMLKEAMNDN
jgi:hypothetical protein